MTINYFETYIRNRWVDQNPFLKMPPDHEDLPAFENARRWLPSPYWHNHDSAIACYWKVWEIAFRNLRNPTPENGFVSPYIDTAFNGNLFMWDSAFILLFARYGRRAFNFQRTLDNLYAKQHPDGFICREIRQSDGADCFKRFDPPATGPNIMPWAEWEYFRHFGDRIRLQQVFPPLLAYHQWLRHYRTWQNGAYWACGWACGMDNQPRLSIHEDRPGAVGDGPVEWWDHDHMAWIDTCLQAVFSARLLVDMAEVLGEHEAAGALMEEIDSLNRLINHSMWDEDSGFYYDRRANGQLSRVKTIGTFWAMLSGTAVGERLEKLVQHLQDPREFNRPHRVPTLSADHPNYHPQGQYWRGGVWAPTNYMVLRGLTQAGQDDLAYEIGLNHLLQVVRVFEQTGTVWENYAPETTARGNISARDFVGWTGIPPVAVLLEYVFGLRPDVVGGVLVWDVRLVEGHGVQRYPFGTDGTLDLSCAPRSSAVEKPVISIQTNIKITLDLRWEGGTERIEAAPI